MLPEVSTFFRHYARGWLILVLLVGFVLFEAATLPWLQRAPGGSIAPLDARFFYTPEEALSVARGYGDARRFWIGAYLTWDMANPVFYTLILVLAISWLFREGVAPESWTQRLNLVPIGAGVCDVLENLAIVSLLTAYPARLRGIAWLSTALTISKFCFLGASLALVVLGASRAAITRLSGKRSSVGRV